MTLRVSHLFFADDTLIFCQPYVRNLLHLRCVLLCFQGVSGLKINLQQSELVRVGEDRDGSLYADVPECKEVSLPIKYLGLPLGAKYKNNVSWELVVEIYKRRLASWKRISYQKVGDLF